MYSFPDPDWLKARLAFINAIRAELADLKALLRQRREQEEKYNPRWREQPRAPKGGPDGGQWVDGGGPKAGGARPPPRPPPQARVVQLVQHERGRSRPWGGHTLERHVGKTHRYLRQRVQSLTVSFGPIFGQRFDFGRVTAGSFTTSSEANRLVNQVLSSHRDQVEAVASGRLLSTILFLRVGSPTGYEAHRQSVRDPVHIRTTYSVIVALRHEPRSHDQFVIATAYPTNRNDAIPAVRIGP